MTMAEPGPRPRSVGSLVTISSSDDIPASLLPVFCDGVFSPRACTCRGLPEEEGVIFNYLSLTGSP